MSTIAGTELQPYHQACAALAAARTTDDLKDVINKVEAFKAYARRAKNRQLEIDAGEIRHRAERRFGELLNELKATGQLVKGRPKEKVGDEEPLLPRVFLDELDATKAFSSWCQRLANASANEFEHSIENWREKALVEEGATKFKLLNGKDKTEQHLELVCEPVLPQQQYGVILANSDCDGVDVLSIAADDCCLGLWATVTDLPKALAFMKVFGFQYKTHFVWLKDKVAIDHWSRNVHELLLLGTRGNPPYPAAEQRWLSAIEAVIEDTENGAKPEIFLEMLEGYFPNTAKIELWRHQGSPRQGWDRWSLNAL